VIAYIDASVLLRVVLGQPDRLPTWEAIQAAVTSGLTEVECLRTLDRRRQQGLLDADELPERRELVIRFLERMERVDITPAVLRRAGDPFPTPLGTLDAIHLATAALWGHARGELPVMATHDAQLAAAARSIGFSTAGL
jgi:predicted nucleic acid-binding protein